MRWLFLYLVLLTGSGLGQGFVNAQGEFQPSPHFKGDALPPPPEQSRPWSPPELAERFHGIGEVAKQLFQDGLADPRACEYRTIKLAVGTCWRGDAGVVETRGWVLPDSTADGRGRFAVAWNGLVYPLVELGEAADLQGDLKTLWDGDYASLRRIGADNEPSGVQPNVAPISACLLLRLGETDAAKRMFAAHFGDRQSGDGSSGRNGLYVGLSVDWLWSLYNRAVCAHMRGDDRLVNASLTLLASKIEGILARMRERLSEDHRQAQYHPLSWMDDWEILLHESHRRLEPEENPPEPDTIGALIVELENVDRRQWGQPGGVHVASDPRVHALVKRGDEAVEALLDCLENDQRLTRSVSFHRNFSRSRTLISVGRAAHAALTEILQFSNFEGVEHRWAVSTAKERVAMAQAIRKYWSENRALMLEERWFATLQQDEVEAETWVEAAKKLTEPPVIYSESPMGVLHRGRAEDDDTPASGEPLRGRQNPSLSELMLRRIGDLDEKRDFVEAVEIAIALARWEAAAHAQEFDALTKRIEEKHQAIRTFRRSLVLLRLCELSRQRIAGGDKSAVVAYAQFMRRQTPKSADGREDDLFLLMSEHADTEAVQQAGAELFGPEGSWHPLIGEDTSYRQNDLVELWTGLVRIPAFRDNLIACLKNTTRIGTLTIVDRGVNIEAKTFKGSRGIPKEAKSVAAPGTTFPLRVCDLVGDEMGAGLREVGLTFEMFREPATRDKQIARVIEHLARTAH